ELAEETPGFRQIFDRQVDEYLLSAVRAHDFIWFVCYSLVFVSSVKGASSFLSLHLRCLLPGFGRVKEELERVVILILLHELEIDQSLGLAHGLTVGESAPTRFQQRRG